MKIFRDSVYGPMRTAFPADNAFYKRHGLFDAPQKGTRMRAFNAVMAPIYKDPLGQEKGIFPSEGSDDQAF